MTSRVPLLTPVVLVPSKPLIATTVGTGGLSKSLKSWEMQAVHRLSMPIGFESLYQRGLEVVLA
jgi:hypothetical protein